MIETFIKTETGTTRAQDTQSPGTRLFREAWQLDGAVIEVDMPKAREIWREKIRAVREPVLKNLDAAYMKALESGDMAVQQDIAAQKQLLRDAPEVPEIEQAESPEQLEAVLPAGLSIN